jgi:serine protease inhibitor
MKAALPAILILTLCVAGCETLVNGQRPSVEPRDLTTAEARVVEADNAFGLKLFRALNREDAGENVFISPLSVSMALGMTLNGARGETREAMKEALELQGLGEEEINEAYRAISTLLQGLDPEVRFRIANSIWYRLGFAVEDEFIEQSRKYFDAEVAELDFAHPDAPATINSWIEDATEGLIDEMIEQIGSDVVMYLVNAIYFKGDWMYPFDVSATRDETFTTGTGRAVTVPMMQQQTMLPFASTDRFLALDLPYGDSLFSMTLLLPREGHSVEDVIDGLSADSWNELSGSFRNTLVSLKMPRFRLEYEKELNQILSDLGMEIAFDRNNADFTGINRDGQLYISLVKHAALVEVDEEGTEAAGATVVEITVTSAPQVQAFYLDRPFVFSIRERTTDSILFIGKVNDPST